MHTLIFSEMKSNTILVDSTAFFQCFHILKEVRPILPESKKTLPNEIAYADDVDFIARERIDVAQEGSKKIQS